MNKILCIGLNTVDLQFLVDIYPDSNSKVKASKNEIFAGGPATNAAITAAFLGSRVTLLSPIGKHSLSEFIKDDIIKHNVDLIDPIENQESKPIFASIITTENSGERTIFSYHPPKQQFECEVAEILNTDYDIVLFDGFYPELAIPFAKNFRDKGITTVLDGGSWKPGLDELLQYIDIAICSDDFYPPNCSTKSEVFHMLDSYHVKLKAITQGDDHILAEYGKTNELINVQKVDVVDTLGAGDIVHGAFCHYFQGDFISALQDASQVASFSCSYFGTREWMEQFGVNV
ncbi:MAG: PfkB family carbohydrate kinase [Bacteroidales bacterium]|nr:PfkB family carbohydrate kinase [Bacteroidales bacterium]